MLIEIRNDNLAIVSGYVNAVERLSRPIYEMGKVFREKISAGAFNEVLQRSNCVDMLIDHLGEKCCANTKDRSLKLNEDNIGLCARAEITNPEYIKMLREKKVTGWSFGFVVGEDHFDELNGELIRTVDKIDFLPEVSLLIDKNPAYIGTSASVNLRSDSNFKTKLELRAYENIDVINEVDFVKEIQPYKDKIKELIKY